MLKPVASQPSIFPFGLRIDEPVATVTDLAVALVCGYAYVQMGRKYLHSRAQVHFRNYFLLVAVATTLGGLIGHGFLYAFSFAWKLPGWLVGIVSVSLVERAAISHARGLIRPGIARFFLALNIVEMVAILVITIATLDFRWVEYHNAYGLIVNVVGFHGYVFYRTRDRGSLIVLGAVVITAVASVVFTRHISLHQWFNYIDMSHVLLAIAAYIMYLGAIRLGRHEKSLQPNSPAQAEAHGRS